MWLLAVLFLAFVAPSRAQIGKIEQSKVDFIHDVQPLLNAKCAACHNPQRMEGGLSLHTRAEMLKGGKNGPAIVPGNSGDSLLIQHVSGFRAPVMPGTGDHLSDEQVQMLRDWVDQGAPFGQVASASQQPQAASVIKPRRPAVPPASIRNSANPIDHFVAAYFSRHTVTAQPAVSDETFARRAFLDVWGLLPSPAQLDEFLRDAGPDKRPRLVEKLLADKANYSEHWISFWNDLLRNDEGVNYAGTRQSISEWLLKALADNMPYAQFTRALLDPQKPGDPAGFLTGVNWRGDVSASQTPVMQAAQNSAQIFLGVNLKCNSCHDSFISNWKLKDAYGLASFFSPSGELDMYRCDVKTGQKSRPQFLFPELGGVDAAASLDERRAAAARLFTAPENGRFTRTLVNRIWQRLFGRGLVEPVDDMAAAAWDSDLLDWLASDFADHGYDLKFLLARMITSQAYQLPAAKAAKKEDSAFVFRGPLVRRLTAEQFADGISAITGEWRVLRPIKAGSGSYVREWRLKSSPLTRALGRPIRDQVFTERNEDPTTLQLLELVNGETLTSLLHRGAQRMLGGLKPAPANLFDSGDLRSGQVEFDIDVSAAKQLRLLIEDADSYDPSRVFAGWANAELVSPAGVTRLADIETKSKFTKGSLEIGKQVYDGVILGALPSEIVYDIAGKGFTRFRATVGVDEKSQLNEISPRVRFFVFTEQPDRQQLVRVAPGAPVAAGAVERDPSVLVNYLYRYALGRAPSAEERRVALEFITPRLTSEGLEDLLWSVFLSPEFQYIE